jgi:hypothetical protein
MTVEMIEAAWLDPMLRRELTEKGGVDLPDHPVGTLKGFPDLFPKAAEATELTATAQCTGTLTCGYYYDSAWECNSTYSTSGDHCCQ